MLVARRDGSCRRRPYAHAADRRIGLDPDRGVGHVVLELERHRELLVRIAQHAVGVDQGAVAAQIGDDGRDRRIAVGGAGNLHRRRHLDLDPDAGAQSGAIEGVGKCQVELEQRREQHPFDAGRKREHAGAGKHPDHHLLADAVADRHAAFLPRQLQQQVLVADVTDERGEGRGSRRPSGPEQLHAGAYGELHVGEVGRLLSGGGTCVVRFGYAHVLVCSRGDWKACCVARMVSERHRLG